MYMMHTKGHVPMDQKKQKARLRILLIKPSRSFLRTKIIVAMHMIWFDLIHPNNDAFLYNYPRDH